MRLPKQQHRPSAPASLGIAYDPLGDREDAKADFMKFSQIVNKKYVLEEHKTKLAEYRISMP